MIGTAVPGSRGVTRLPWPLSIVARIWGNAVVDEHAVRFNLRLLTVLTAVFGLPDLVQGLMTAAGATSAGMRFFGAYVLTLGLLELGGAALLASRRDSGRRLIVAAAAGFYLEAVMGLAGFERGPIAMGLFALGAPADAWVIWFLSHARVRAYLARRRGWLFGEQGLLT